jgi:hypothetical protein
MILLSAKQEAVGPGCKDENEARRYAKGRVIPCCENEVRHESYDEFLLPEEVERDYCGDDVCRELRRVNLVEEDFFLRCHVSTVAWGREVGSYY